MAITRVNAPDHIGTVSDIATTTGLKNGQVTQLLGYNAVGDGGGGTVAYSSTGRSGLDSTLIGGFYFNGPGADDYLERVDKTRVWLPEWGCFPGRTATDITNFALAGNASISQKVPFVIPPGDYELAETLQWPDGRQGINVIGGGRTTNSDEPRASSQGETTQVFWTGAADTPAFHLSCRHILFQNFSIVDCDVPIWVDSASNGDGSGHATFDRMAYLSCGPVKFGGIYDQNGADAIFISNRWWGGGDSCIVNSSSQNRDYRIIDPFVAFKHVFFEIGGGGDIYIHNMFVVDCPIIYHLTVGGAVFSTTAGRVHIDGLDYDGLQHVWPCLLYDNGGAGNDRHAVFKNISFQNTEGSAPQGERAIIDTIEGGTWSVDASNWTNFSNAHVLLRDNDSTFMRADFFSKLGTTNEVRPLIEGDANAVSAAIQDNGGAFTDFTTEANEATADDVDLLPATPADDDAFYIGYSAKFGKAKISLSTTGVGTWDIDWEYYDGSSWIALTGVTDTTSSFKAVQDADYDANSYRTVRYSVPLDWMTTTVNSQGPYYYIRGVVSSYSAVTTQPQAKQIWCVETDAGTARIDLRDPNNRTGMYESGNVLFKSAPPTSGYYREGETFVINSDPKDGQPAYWYCTETSYDGGGWTAGPLVQRADTHYYVFDDAADSYLLITPEVNNAEGDFVMNWKSQGCNASVSAHMIAQKTNSGNRITLGGLDTSTPYVSVSLGVITNSYNLPTGFSAADYHEWELERSSTTVTISMDGSVIGSDTGYSTGSIPYTVIGGKTGDYVTTVGSFYQGSIFDLNIDGVQIMTLRGVPDAETGNDIGTINLCSISTNAVTNDWRNQADQINNKRKNVIYTASEGVVIAGQGTTNDVTIKNDNDDTAIAIATGTTVLSTTAVQHQATETTLTPTGTTQTMTCDTCNHQTLALTSATGTVTFTLTVPTNICQGTIVIKQHASAAKDLTWAVSSGLIRWMAAEPNWGADATSSIRLVDWRFDGTDTYLTPSAVAT